MGSVLGSSFRWLLVATVAACAGESTGSPAEQTAGHGGSGQTGTGDDAGVGGTGANAAGSAGDAAAGGSAGSGVPPCTLSSGDADCDTCFRSQCASSCMTASAQAEMLAYVSCRVACSDPACLSSCDAQHPDAAKAFAPFGTCVWTRCAGTCEVLVEPCVLQLGDPCNNACLQMTCYDQCLEATHEPGFEPFLQCATACKDQSCLEACYAEYPDAAVVAQALYACIDTNCPSEC